MSDNDGVDISLILTCCLTHHLDGTWKCKDARYRYDTIISSISYRRVDKNLNIVSMSYRF